MSKHHLALSTEFVEEIQWRLKKNC